MTALSTRSDAPDIGEATYPRPAIDDGRLVVIERLSPVGEAILTDGTHRALDALTIRPRPPPGSAALATGLRSSPRPTSPPRGRSSCGC